MVMSIKNDGKIVKASFKDCLISDRKLFPSSNCIVPISVGQKVHEGEKFLATIQLINAYFTECTILVDDTIQRHTMKIESTADDEALNNLSFLEGSNWISRNSYICEKLAIPYKVMRWNDWLNDSHYSFFYHMVCHSYSNNLYYMEAFNKNIEEFLSRYKNRFDVGHFDYSSAFSYCLDYLKEECAVMCLWAENKYDFEVYPTGRNRAMAATYELLIKPRYPGFLKSVSLRFKKYRKVPLMKMTG